MPRESFTNVDAYIASFPESTQRVLSEIRATVRLAAPGAEEVISYQIACYKVRKWRFYFAGFKGHYSVFIPNAGDVLAAFGPELAKHHVSKATFHFSLAEPVPVELLARVIRFSLEHEPPPPPPRARARRTNPPATGDSGSS